MRREGGREREGRMEGGRKKRKDYIYIGQRRCVNETGSEVLRTEKLVGSLGEEKVKNGGDRKNITSKFSLLLIQSSRNWSNQC